jgi:hypothetical protein
MHLAAKGSEYPAEHGIRETKHKLLYVRICKSDWNGVTNNYDSNDVDIWTSPSCFLNNRLRCLSSSYIRNPIIVAAVLYKLVTPNVRARNNNNCSCNCCIFILCNVFILGIVVVIVVFLFCVECSLCVYFVYCVSFERCVILYDVLFLYDVCYLCVVSYCSTTATGWKPILQLNKNIIECSMALYLLRRT